MSACSVFHPKGSPPSPSAALPAPRFSWQQGATGAPKQTSVLPQTTSMAITRVLIQDLIPGLTQVTVAMAEGALAAVVGAESTAADTVVVVGAGDEDTVTEGTTTTTTTMSMEVMMVASMVAVAGMPTRVLLQPGLAFPIKQVRSKVSTRKSPLKAWQQQKLHRQLQLIWLLDHQVLVWGLCRRVIRCK